MSSEQPVFESKATYYKTTDKKWISGTFTLNGNKIQFHGDENNPEHSLRLLLSNISGLEKRQSSFIYAAVVITIGVEKHWFASFPNRDAVYNLLELFWRESLLSVTTRKSPSQPREASSSLGKDLLSILHESEATLIDAANALSSQGRQLEESQVLMQDINSDLNAAEKFLKSMSFPQAMMGLKESESKTSEEKVLEEEPRQKSFKVTFSEKGCGLNDYEKGTLVIADQITVSDDFYNKHLQISNKEVEKILITSPWAFSLEYSSEWATKTCHFICPQLAGLLKFLKCIITLKSKIVYENETPSDNAETYSSNISTGGLSSSELPNVNPRPLENLKSDSTEILVQDQGSVISDEDMLQISNVLNSLQSLAVEVSREQQDQMEKINSLITDVDKTGLRIDSSNKTIKKNM